MPHPHRIWLQERAERLDLRRGLEGAGGTQCRVHVRPVDDVRPLAAGGHGDLALEEPGLALQEAGGFGYRGQQRAVIRSRFDTEGDELDHGHCQHDSFSVHQMTSPARTRRG